MTDPAALPPTTDQADLQNRISPREGWLIGLLFLVLLGLKVAYAYHFRIDTDEVQHLHLVWAWSKGLLPYRDVFDNHGPIFHLLYSPLFRVFGERADIIIPMRLAVIPLWAISMGCVYILGKTIFSPKVGIWAVLFTAFYPEFLFTSTEFRTDDLWMTVWLVAMVIAVRGTLQWKRAFGVGLLLGAAFAVTVKTGLMVGSIGFAGALLVAWGLRWGIKADWSLILRLALAAFAGLLVIPALLVLFFAWRGALRDFIYCNITHNLVPHGQNWGRLDGHLLWFPVFCLGVAVLIAWRRPANWDRST
ncbi:MAG TPA: glycosyltransferase family 39 protein, partial [Chthoniobacter sp.]|nr:glycosyltransferase family 39 protein [Chthoniobacter sp.]